MNSHQLLVTGRGLIGVMFVISAMTKTMNRKEVIGLMRDHRMPFPALSLGAAVLLEGIGAISLITGLFLVPVSIALTAYVVVATIAIPLQDALRNRDRAEAINVINSNIAIIGGLMVVLAVS